MTNLTINDFNGKVLVEYKRDKNRTPYGVVVAIGPDMVGWSLCNKKDKFTKAEGLHFALYRALAIKECTVNYKIRAYEDCPTTLRKQFDRMIERSLLYFK